MNHLLAQTLRQSPIETAFAITPSDSLDLIQVTDALYVGGGGNIAVTLADGVSEITFSGVGAGAVLPLRVKRVKATGTTATLLIGLV